MGLFLKICFVLSALSFQIANAQMPCQKQIEEFLKDSGNEASAPLAKEGWKFYRKGETTNYDGLKNMDKGIGQLRELYDVTLPNLHKKSKEIKERLERNANIFNISDAGELLELCKATPDCPQAEAEKLQKKIQKMSPEARNLRQEYVDVQRKIKELTEKSYDLVISNKANPKVIARLADAIEKWQNQKVVIDGIRKNLSSLDFLRVQIGSQKMELLSPELSRFFQKKLAKRGTLEKKLEAERMTLRALSDSIDQIRGETKEGTLIVYKSIDETVDSRDRKIPRHHVIEISINGLDVPLLDLKTCGWFQKDISRNPIEGRTLPEVCTATPDLDYQTDYCTTNTARYCRDSYAQLPETNQKHCLKHHPEAVGRDLPNPPAM